MLDFPLLVQISIHGGGPELFFFYGIVGVVSRKGGSLRLIDFNNFDGNSVKEIPVMGNDDHGTLVI